MTASDMAVIPLEVVIGLLEASLARGSSPPPQLLTACLLLLVRRLNSPRLSPSPRLTTAKALARRLMV